MIRIHITNDKQNQQFEHAAGPLEFGRGPRHGASRCVIEDAFFSRDQLRVQEVPGGLRLENLSQKNAVSLSDGNTLAVGAAAEVVLPVSIALGQTVIAIDSPATEPFDKSSLMTIRQPLRVRGEASLPSLNDLGETPAPEKLAHWLETVIALERADTGDAAFFDKTARALVELVGLDVGMVLLARGGDWERVALYTSDGSDSARFSRTLIEHVVQQRQSFYQDFSSFSTKTVSLENVAAVVVSPVFGLNDEVVGVLYGIRTRKALMRVGSIRPLEAQVVQLLAAAVGANLARVVATRTRVQFEQFFSPELARELERNPALLEGRDQEVTILISDLRGFSVISERLGPDHSCRLIREMMECLSEPITAQGGVIVDYAGDGILAMWNAPAALDDHAAHACSAALGMLAALPQLSDSWRDRVERSLRIGIGINTGHAQVGNIGSSRKFKYGPNGHTVNLASRVQDMTKRLGLPLLITHSTRLQLPDSFASRRLGRVRMPGVSEAVELHELRGPDAEPHWMTQRSIYEQALGLYEARQWAQACRTLIQMPDFSEPRDHYDNPSIKLMKRAWTCLEVPPEPFDPVID